MRYRPCRWCGKVFYICRCCDHGHAYCPGAQCGVLALRRQRREARKRHQDSEEGRLDHRDRQARYRESLRQRVTDQGRNEPASSGTLASAGTSVVEVTAQGRPAEERSDETRGSRRRMRTEVRCAVCGRTSRWVVWWPVERSLREPRRRC